MEERLQYLFRRYLDNSCSRPELEEFFSLIRAAEHDELLRGLVKKAYDNIRQTPASGTYVNEAGNLVSTGEDWLSGAGIRPGRRRVRTRVAAIVFAWLSVAGIVGWLQYRPKPPAATPVVAALSKKTTERSEYKYVLLPDSTQVWLNASSSLEYPDHFGAGRREVSLSGEAYFDVKHADKTPLIIHTGKISTTVLGTAFNIKAYPGRDNIVVSVSRGRVRVSFDDKPVATLTRGQQVKVSSAVNKAVEKKIAPADVAAWQQGNMTYDDETFADIIADLERLYNVNIRIDNAAIRSLKLSTTFRREIGIEQALQVLCQLTDSNLKQAGGWYIIQ